MTRKWLPQWLNKGLARADGITAIGTMGGFVATELIKRERQKWGTMEAAFENINAYNLGRGAGHLLGEWLERVSPGQSAEQAMERLGQVVSQMDGQDSHPADRARSRFLASKALFYLEGFKLSRCHYEDFQQQARELLRQLPSGGRISRQDIFLGKPFEPEYIIGTVHRMLMLLSEGDEERLERFLAEVKARPARDVLDYFRQLIARTFGMADPDRLKAEIVDWFESYREYEICRTHSRERMVSQSIEGIGAVVSGGLPALAGKEVLNRLVQGLVRKKP